MRVLSCDAKSQTFTESRKEGDYIAIELRPYQRQCIDTITSQPPGSYLVQLPTGCGKTVTFANIPRQGRVLILSHREELVEQPRKYYDCSYGIERASQHSHGEEVVSASVQSMVKRLYQFQPEDFDMIIVDECHHAASQTYRKILNYFRPEKLIGVTATPIRGDKVRLDDIFQKIIFKRDLRWAIEQGYLCDILCKRVNIGYDLSAVHTRHGDYAPGELDEAMDGTADAIAQAYREHSKGPTLIFAVSVRHANEIAARIPGAAVVTGKTKDRASIIQAFEKGKIPAIVNVMVFTEGTDIPCIETCIMARPTQSDSLYCQCVGRALRPYPGKEKAILIDCVGVSGKRQLCTAPTLLGLDISNIPESRRQEIEGPIFELLDKAVLASDCPESWIRNVEIVDLWASQNQYNTHGINFFKQPTGAMTVSLPEHNTITIPAPDLLGNVPLKDGGTMPMQEAIDTVYARLLNRYQDEAYIWDLARAKSWMNKPASDKQVALVSRFYPDFDCERLTKGQASQILNRRFAGR